MEASAHVGRIDWIAVDWGTSTMRAWGIDADGRTLATEPPGPGMGALEPGEFEDALLRAVGSWLDGPTDVLVCGMAGARQGWREAPYHSVPASLDQLLDGVVEVPTKDDRLRVRIVPGLRVSDGGRHDVMRGEETQLLGFLHREQLRDAGVCLPGTHAKWVRLAGGTVVDFRTYLTGELFALLSERSILRHSVGEGWDDDAFVDGVRLGAGDAVGHLFSIRATDLLAAPDPGAARARLSGIVIGAELASALTHAGPVDAPIHVVAADALARRYLVALRALGRTGIAHDGGELALAGLVALRLGGA